MTKQAAEQVAAKGGARPAGSKKLLIFEALPWQKRDSRAKSFLVLFFKKERLSYLPDR
jgi:hypothetical protein